MDYKKNDLARFKARYDLMNSIAHRKNYWNPKPSRHKSMALQKWEDRIQAWIDILYDSEYTYNSFEWEKNYE